MASPRTSLRAALDKLRTTPTRRARWWVTWAVLFAVMAVWSISQPLFSGPDEPSHVVKAAGLVRGELIGSDKDVTPPGEAGPRIVTMVRVPAVFGLSHQMPTCYKFRPNVTAGCAGAFAGPTREVDVPTTAGHYQPLYYGIVGLPSLVLPSAKGVFLMRLLGAAVVAALLASALSSATMARRPGLVVIGTAIAITPMVLYMGSIVNPSGLEIAAALCLWVSALVLVVDLGGTGDGRLLARICVSGAALALSRGLSPLWLAVIAVLVLIAARPGTLATLSRRRDVRLCAAALAAAFVVAAAWLVLAGALESREPPPAPAPSLSDAARQSLGRTNTKLGEMIGWFGWLDVQSPMLTRVVWLSTVGAAVLGAFVLGRRRYVLALALLVSAVVVLPVVLETIQSSQMGPFWQGRYTLPLAVGIPPLAALAVAERVRIPAGILARLSAVVLGALALGHVLAFAVVARRFTVGMSGQVLYLQNDAGWRPPLPAWLLLLGVVLAVGALATWLHLLATRGTPVDDDAPTTATLGLA